MILDTERKKYDFYGSRESAKIRAAQQLRGACMHLCLLACNHCVAKLQNEFWQTHRNQKSASRIFCDLYPPPAADRSQT